MKNVKIALLGLGNVGKGVWMILKNNSDEINRRSGSEIEIAKILVRDINKKRDIDVPKEILTTNIEDILNDESIKIVVELIGGTDPAKDYMLRAIRKKKHVVTANKLIVANEGEELIKASREEGVLFFYEGSVAGGIPILRGIEESLTANRIEEIVGIINGTTNYILTRMTQDRLSFNEALDEARKRGYAEADPTSDIESHDAVYKLCILTSLAFDIHVKVKDIYREGICKISILDIENAKEFGYTIKLLAILKDSSSGLELRVQPAMIPSNHPLANVNDAFNAILIKGNAVGDLMLYGKGAGSLPTGSAVVGDIISVLRNNMKLNYVPKSQEYLSKPIIPIANTISQFYIRISVEDAPGVLGEILSILGRNDVSIASFVQKGNMCDGVPLVFVTHKTLEGNIAASIDEIRKLSTVKRIENVIRVENFN